MIYRLREDVTKINDTGPSYQYTCICLKCIKSLGAWGHNAKHFVGAWVSEATGESRSILPAIGPIGVEMYLQCWVLHHQGENGERQDFYIPTKSSLFLFCHAFS